MRHEDDGKMTGDGKIPRHDPIQDTRSNKNYTPHISNLPAEVIATVKHSHPGATLTNAEAIHIKGATKASLYEIKLKTNNKIKEVKIKANGDIEK